LDKVGWVDQLNMNQEDALKYTAPIFNWLKGNLDNCLNYQVYEKDVQNRDPYRNGEDYIASWEDAFLFQGFDNGKYGFLTTQIMYHIDKYGFVSTATYHWPEKKNPKLGSNEIIVRLQYKGEDCIGDVDKKGEKIILGVTEPRSYLPNEVIMLFDTEFGLR